MKSSVGEESAIWIEFSSFCTYVSIALRSLNDRQDEQFYEKSILN